MKKPLPIGISDYKTLIEDGYYYVDKTLLIQELLQAGGGVALICRPRRFGKTLNLSMLHYFFEKTDESNAYLFTDKAIWQDETCRSLQGQSPVIFLTFKDIKEKTWQVAYDKIIRLIAREYKRHQTFIEANENLINRNDFVIFQALAEGSGSYTDLSQSLLFLSMLLETITKKRVVLLIDEYDTPIHAAYNNGYYDEMIDFMRGFLSAGFKDNKHLGRAVLTGILRTAKEGIFSGLNNLNVCTLLHDSFADKFGFVSGEVDALLKNQDIAVPAEVIKDWYNGYHAGENVLLYNPWSILECARNKGVLQAYWVNTSDNVLIKKCIAQSHEDTKKELEQLLTKNPLIKNINEAFSFSDADRDPDFLWNLLLFTGYITYAERTLTKQGKYSCSLVIPNNEIDGLYYDLLKAIFTDSLKITSITSMLNALKNGDVDRFSKSLQEFVANSMSYYDFSHDEPEQSYHLFILGMLLFLSDDYDVRSNRESGDGRYDVMLIPKDKTLMGIIIECKKADSDKQQDFEKSVHQAMEQVKQNNYVQELRAQSIKNVIIYAIAFYGKKLLIKAEKI